MLGWPHRWQLGVEQMVMVGDGNVTIEGPDAGQGSASVVTVLSLVPAAVDADSVCGVHE